MKKFTLLLSLFLAIISLHAQDYKISFAGTNASATVNTVKVENLSQGTSLNLIGSDVLHLVGTSTGVNSMPDVEDAFRIYPNPTSGKSKIDFVANASGTTLIELFDITGKRLSAYQNNLTIGTHSFQISGLRSGIYTVRIYSQTYSYTGKLVSNGAPYSGLQITYIGNGAIPVTAMVLKSASVEKTMSYNVGDLLKFTGTTGPFSTIVTDVPSKSKTITFRFMGCTDADGNNYPIVQIGTQLWMAENLKTTHYADGHNIQNITANSDWDLGQGYCWYANNISNKNIYGALYGYWLIHYENTYGGISPKGWSIPTDVEWSTLTNYLGGLGVSGGKLKESGTTHWNYPNSGATNESGFTGLPGGYRVSSGLFSGLGSSGDFWTTSQSLGFPDYTAWYRDFTYNFNSVGRFAGSESSGLSIRCIWDNITPGAVLPVITTRTTSSITSNSAISGGNINTDGGSIVTNRGVCWNNTGNPTVADNFTSDGNGIGSFASNLTSLNGNNTYYIRAYATNGIGTVYGNQITLTIAYGYATVNTTNALDINYKSVVCGGNITNDGGVPVTERGICYSTDQNPTINNSKLSMGLGTGTFSNTISNLSGNTTYYVRAYATNIFGTSYGNQITFTTLTFPTVITSDFSGMTSSSVISGGSISSDGGSAVIERGICYSTTEYPTISRNKILMGDGIGTFKGTVSGLEPNTTYYLRAFATNGVGTSYGNSISFKTFTGTVTDVEGNVYNTVTIGNQVWTVENLKTTKYNDGTNIPNVTDNALWGILPSPCYSWYNNSISNKNIYGALYNWYTINSGKLCPPGWHVPTITEWATLVTYIGGESFGAVKLKETGNTHWSSSNTAATNETGFTAIPAGSRTAGTGYFSGIGTYCGWWSSSEYDSDYAGSQSISGYVLSTNYYDSKKYGYSVRCIKNGPPAVTTAPATKTTTTSSIIGGNIPDDGGAAVTERGICYSTSQNPTTSNSKMIIGTGTGSFSKSITGLAPGATYYVRAYAINSMGTGYGNEISFITFTGTVTDIEGNVYNTVTIGSQVWMAENLKTTKYRDGTIIYTWGVFGSPGYGWYNNDVANKNTYGALYNWYAVNTGKLAPAGWHVASDAEWTTLTNYLGGPSNAGGKLKETGTDHWSYPNTSATNETSFSALPGGYLNISNVTSYDIGISLNWWSSSEYTTENALARSIKYNESQVIRSQSTKGSLLSVRCIMDPHTSSAPTVAAPTPTVNASLVISIFSDAYTNLTGTNFNPNWGQTTVTTQVSITGNNTLKLAGLDYQGINIGSADGTNQNLSAMRYLHLDYWSSNSTSLFVYLINPGPIEKEYNLTVPTTGWKSVDIPLSSFSTVDLTKVFQFKFAGNGNVYIDNLYFRQ